MQHETTEADGLAHISGTFQANDYSSIQNGFSK